jgi:hypothetical protein
MAYYKKYQLEFDDVIEGEFNEYRLELHKLLNTDEVGDFVYGTSFDDSSGWTLDAGAIISGSSLSITAGGGFVGATRTLSTIAGYYVVSFTNITGVTTRVVVSDDASATIFSEAISQSGVYTSDVFFISDDNPTTIKLSAIGGSQGITDLTVTGYVGDASGTLQGTGEPLILNYENTGDDVLSPIKSSYLDINFYQTSDSQDYTDLFTPEDLDFKVFLYKNDSLYWQGWLYPSLVTIASTSVPRVISLAAYDGLHLIKNINYFATDLNSIRTSPDATDRFDYQSLLNSLIKCLYNTGVDNSYYFQCRLKNEDVSGASYTDFFTHTRTYHRTWIEDQISMTCYEVLDHICNDIGLSVYQRDGNWVVNRISDFAFNLSGENALAVTVVNSTTQLPSSIGNVASSNYVGSTTFLSINGASITYQYATSKVTVNHDHDQNFMTGDLTPDEAVDTSANGFSYWKARNDSYAEEVVVIKNDTNYTESGDNSGNNVFTEINLIVSPLDNVNAYFANIFSGDNQEQTFTTQPIKFSSVPFQRTFRIQLDARPLFALYADQRAILGYAIQQFAAGSEVWSNTIYAYEEGGLEGFDITFDNTQNEKAVVEPNEWTTIDIITPIVSNTTGTSTEVDHNFCFRFYGSVLYLNEDAGDGFIDGTFFFDTSLQNVIITPTIGDTRQLIPVEAEYILESANNYSYKYADMSVHAGSNIVSNGSKAYLSYDASTGNLSDIAQLSWNVWTDGVIESMTIQHAKALSKLRLTHKPNRRLVGTHYGNYTFGNLINYETASGVQSGKFFPLNCTIDLRNARTQFTADEILLSGEAGSLTDLTVTKKIIWKDSKNSSFTETL